MTRSIISRIGSWLIMALAVVVALAGLLLTAGGIYLITLGGSWYYLIAMSQAPPTPRARPMTTTIRPMANRSTERCGLDI